MAKNIFVSYNFNDRKVAKTVKKMMQRHQDDIEGQIVFIENDVSYNGETAIDWEVEHVMEECDAALFVLGDDQRNSPWLDKEAKHAVARNIPILATTLPDTNIEQPRVLQNADCTMLHWNGAELSTHLNQC